jgi:hypothetical protein
MFTNGSCFKPVLKISFSTSSKRIGAKLILAGMLITLVGLLVPVFYNNRY